MNHLNRHTVIPAVYIIFRDGGKVFLLRRYQTGWRDGEYTFPSGHLDGNESLKQAAIRESKEEVGVDIKPEDLKLVHVTHHVADEGDHERMDFYFEVLSYSGELKNNEPHKCDEAGWFDLDNLPENIIPTMRESLPGIAQGKNYTDFAFKR